MKHSSIMYDSDEHWESVKSTHTPNIRATTGKLFRYTLLDTLSRRLSQPTRPNNFLQTPHNMQQNDELSVQIESAVRRLQLDTNALLVNVSCLDGKIVARAGDIDHDHSAKTKDAAQAVKEDGPFAELGKFLGFLANKRLLVYLFQGSSLSLALVRLQVKKASEAVSKAIAKCEDIDLKLPVFTDSRQYFDRRA